MMELESSYHRSPTKRNIRIKNRSVRFPGTDKISKLFIKLSFTLRVFNIYLSLTLGNFSDYEISELKT